MIFKKINLVILGFSVLAHSCGNGKSEVLDAKTNSGNSENVECSCKSTEKEESAQEESSIAKREIVFACEGNLMDGSLKQKSWEGLEEYAKNNEKSITYVQPKGSTYDDYLAMYNNAIKLGARIIITSIFPEDALEEVSKKNPDVKFVLLDAPYNYVIKENCTGISWNFIEAGFIAGYAAVKEGYKNLGGVFAGNGENHIVNSYAYGYAQGINVAAADIDGVMCKISFGPTINYSRNFLSQMFSWYTDGTEVIFCCDSSMKDLGLHSIARTASEAITETDNKKAKIIGSFGDKYNFSTRVITSATIDNYKATAKKILELFFNSEWEKSLNKQRIEMGVKEEAVGIAYHSDRLFKFSKEDYTALLDRIKEGKVTIKSDINQLKWINQSGFWDDINTDLKNISIWLDA